MDQLKTLVPALTVAVLACLCAPIQAQTANGSSAAANASQNANAPQEKPVPGSVRLKPYFSDSLDPHRPHSVEFRAVDQMTAQDRQQAANAESSIGEHAKYAGLEFNQGQWSYQQVLCPALPNHIFLRFLRNNGTGDVSVFTASIPRGDQGRVRIIPIQLRGYSLFSPAPINALTISAFNHIRAEENPDQDPGKAPDWLGTGLCYAALAGGHPQAAPGHENASDNPAGEKFPVGSTALLDVENGGGAVLSFTDVSVPSRPRRWSMTFDRKGRLIKCGHSPAPLLQISIQHPLPVDVIGKPKPMTVPKVRTYNPPTPAVVTENPPAPPQTPPS
ncbi:MAG TPA: hypothetical protein VGG56_03905 [Terracidiphilus sp.]|jgi:hypothetical protein